jgi:hypothetical protein
MFKFYEDELKIERANTAGKRLQLSVYMPQNNMR